MDNILCGLGTSSSRSGSGSANRSGTTTNVAPSYEVPAQVNTNAAHQTGHYYSNGTYEYSNSDGDHYTVTPDGEVTYWKTEPTETDTSTIGTGTTAEADDNMILWVLLPLVALGVAKFVKNQKNAKGKRKK